MSMLDIHASALETVNEAYHDFLLRYKRTTKTVYGFVEGKDDPSFYRSVIERFIPEDWSVDLIRAGNRDKVLAAERDFDWTRFSQNQVTFFVDRDLTDFVDPPIVYSDNTYVTDGYSIENSIVTSDVMLRLLSEVHNVVDWTGEEQQALVDYFNTELSAFCNIMTAIMAQILYWRIEKCKANLNNLDLSSLLRFDDGNIKSALGLEAEEARLDRLCACVEAQKASDAKIAEMKAAFLAAHGPNKLVRGKYLVWFLSTIVNEIHQRISFFVSSYKRPPKSKLSIGPNNVMVVAAPRARIPTSLRNFIESTFIQHVMACEGV